MRTIIALLICIFSLSVSGQFSISGEVMNEAGEKLEAAVIYLKDTNYSTISNAKGEYLLENIQAGDYTIVTTYLGYANLENSINVQENKTLDFTMRGQYFQLDKIEIISNRIADNEPFTYDNLDREYLSLENLGQDAPYLIQYTPSVVVTSDAGTGIGYTGVRLRGSDPTRINVTINGVALNDSESQGVFWVNMPDFMSSVNDMQIQRGVGPSTNGGSAFGGTISLNTQDVKINEYVDINSTIGSFNTRKLSVSTGTGILNNNLTLDARYSLIQSDGFIDRGQADLNSWYANIAKVNSKSSIRFIAFGGHEITNQAWYGVPESRVNGDQEELLNHYNRNIGSLYNTPQDSMNLFNSGRNYNYYTYDNQVDDYTQNHFQLLYSRQLSDNINWKTTLHYTRGKGFFEEFKYNDGHADYGLDDYTDESGTLVTNSDIIRRKWLDNHYFGFNTHAEYQMTEQLNLDFGASLTDYIGDHFGELVSIANYPGFEPGSEYYFNQGNKLDGNVFARANYTLGNLTLFGDVQARYIEYTIDGIDDTLLELDYDDDFIFFNPKAGINLAIDKSNAFYASVAVAQKEPARSDFLNTTNLTRPSSERLVDYEAGYNFNASNVALSVNAYFMDYKDQLVLTGDLNDVGASLRANVPDSYRLGLEVAASTRIFDKLTWDFNTTLSRNKIEEFNEVLFDYTNGFERIVNTYEDVDIAFSPSFIVGSQINFTPFNNASIGLNTKFVGKQYLDNTMNESRVIDPYLVNGLRLNYQLNPKFMRAIEVTLMVNNLFDAEYSSNGYTYSYIFEDLITENYLYPQAGRNYLLGVSLRL